MRFKKMLEEGHTQKQLAEAAHIPPSAINLLVKSAKGVGPSTAAAFVKLLGFETRGQLTDAADEWWERDGKSYAIREMRAMVEERRSRTAPSHSSGPPAADESGEVTTAHRRKRRKTA